MSNYYSGQSPNYGQPPIYGQPSQQNYGQLPNYGQGPPLSNYGQPPQQSFTQPQMNYYGTTPPNYGQGPLSNYGQPPQTNYSAPVYGQGPPPPTNYYGGPLPPQQYGQQPQSYAPPMNSYDSMGSYDPFNPSVYYDSQPISLTNYHGQGGWNVEMSACTGRKKALLIGINYLNSKSPLSGCIRDTRKIKHFLTKYFAYPDDPQSIVTLTDDAKDPAMMATRYNIFTAMQWLVSNNTPGDSLFFYFSGHGGQVKDLDGDEDDGMDETILPQDYKQAGEIIDDDLHRYLVSALPHGVRLTALFDSCHSGTALDLPFVYNERGEIIEGQELLDPNALQGRSRRTQKRINLNAMKQTPADVVSISGCRDEQVSQDATIEGYGRTGVMSYAFISVLRENPETYSYLTLLREMRKKLKEKGYAQEIQLSTGHPIDMRLQVLI